MTTIPTHTTPWSPARRVTDYLFRWSIPGRHHTLTSALAPLMTVRELRA